MLEGEIFISNYSHTSLPRTVKSTSNTRVLILSILHYCPHIRHYESMCTLGSSEYVKTRENIRLRQWWYITFLRREVPRRKFWRCFYRSVCFSDRGSALSSLNFLSFYVAACLFILHPHGQGFLSLSSKVCNSRWIRCSPSWESEGIKTINEGAFKENRKLLQKTK